jgi:predicted RND superfamily exporter protein
MASTSHQAGAGQRAQDAARGRGGAALLALTRLTLALVAVQFALAGFGAFSAVQAPARHDYGAHMVLGVIIGALTWLILAAVLVSRPARTRRVTVWPAVALALLTIPVEPLLAEAGRRVPFVGALHALNGLAICALTVVLMLQATRRRTAARGATAPAADSHPADSYPAGSRPDSHPAES